MLLTSLEQNEIITVKSHHVYVGYFQVNDSKYIALMSVPVQ